MWSFTVIENIEEIQIPYIFRIYLVLFLQFVCFSSKKKIWVFVEVTDKTYRTQLHAFL